MLQITTLTVYLFKATAGVIIKCTFGCNTSVTSNMCNVDGERSGEAVWSQRSVHRSLIVPETCRWRLCRGGISCVSLLSSHMFCLVLHRRPCLPWEHPFCSRHEPANFSCSEHERPWHSMECGPSYLPVAPLQYQLVGLGTLDIRSCPRRALLCPRSGRRRPLFHSRSLLE